MWIWLAASESGKGLRQGCRLEMASTDRKSTSLLTISAVSICSCMMLALISSILLAEDTLTAPQHWGDEPFELIVSNPPYSIKWAGDDNPLLINDPRFSPAGVLAPKSKKPTLSPCHCTPFPGLHPMARRRLSASRYYVPWGGAEQKIRKYLIDNNFIDCISPASGQSVLRNFHCYLHYGYVKKRESRQQNSVY